MRSSYLVRITDVCADMAAKLMVDASRDGKDSAQPRVASRRVKNIKNEEENSGSSWQLRDEQYSADYDLPTHSVIYSADEDATPGDPVDTLQFAAFVRDLDSLRRRMLGVSFCDRVWNISREVSGVAERADDARPAEISDGEQALKSVRDAITNAVLLLPYQGADARRAR